MNDPGLDEPISAVDDQFKNRFEADSQSDLDEHEEEKDFLLPARWWYASTAFPLLAGTFGPMANSFNLCALVENWRVEIPPGGVEEHGIDIKDPRWLIGINALSFTFATIANLTLMLNMARRLSFTIAQPITILGFWIASLLLIALVAVAAHHFHAPGVKNQALTQAYYYAIFAAALYQIIAYLMCVTIWGAYKGHYSKEFKLTISQRTLMLQTISFMVYILIGALIFSKVEGWKFLDAVYWADFTLLTIGIGDYSPATHLGRSLLIPYAIGGVVTLGLVVGSIRTLGLESGGQKMAARMTEKTRRRIVKSIQKATEDGSKVKHIKGVDKEDSAALSVDPQDQKSAERRRRKAEFDAMRRVQELAAKERKWFALTVSALVWMLLWLIGALIFMYAEQNQQWTYFGSLYFAYTSLLTIGYGDFYPMSNSGKPFFVFWSLLAVPTLTILISNMGDTLVKGVKEATIYVGEITVLPGEEAGVRERLKRSMKMLTGDKLGPISNKLRNTANERFEDAPPGTGGIHGEHRGNPPNHGDTEAIQRIANDFVQAEKISENEARGHGDQLAEDEHHYRHILISETRKVYADVMSPEPKKYSYEEWSWYLRLLGQDERDAKFHRKPPIKLKEPGDRSGNESRAKEKQQSTGQTDKAFAQKEQEDEELEQSESGEVTKWSWIGNRSPLMGQQSESEWILENLFRKLEEDLREQRKMGKKLRKRKKDEERNDNEEKREKAKEDWNRSSSKSASVSGGQSSRPTTR